MKKYFFRFAIAVFVYLFFKLTKAASLDEALQWHRSSTDYMIYTVSVVMILWEVIARSINYFSAQAKNQSPNRFITIIFFKAAAICAVLVTLFAYLFNYHFINWAPADCCMEKTRFIADAATGFVMGLLIIYSEVVRLSAKNAIKAVREKEIIQKELLSAKYEGLKSQVNPHFLFNSFSTLTSLVETNSEEAVKFIDKLSDLYRYVLDHDTDNLVSLKDELDFLNDYLFLLQMRHQSGIKVTNNLDLPVNKIMVPSLSLQTLVENAVKHNAFSIDDPLEIVIGNEGTEFITIKNAFRPKNSPLQSTKIGLKNLSKRIKHTLKKELLILQDDNTFVVKLPIG